jgi:hypothetical protein
VADDPDADAVEADVRAHGLFSDSSFRTEAVPAFPAGPPLPGTAPPPWPLTGSAKRKSG